MIPIVSADGNHPEYEKKQKTTEKLNKIRR